MESWQAVLMVFFVLLPLVLMLDFWGDERLTARGRPIPREWHHQVRSGPNQPTGPHRSSQDETASPVAGDAASEVPRQSGA